QTDVRLQLPRARPLHVHRPGGAAERHGTAQGRFTYNGKAGELGKDTAVTMTVDGKKGAQSPLPPTLPLPISLGEGFDLGLDSGSAVDFTYKPPFRFTGKIEKVTVDLK